MKIHSFRRELLDRKLEASVALMRGRVLDIGGQREKRRGTFRPPVDRVEAWEYLNIDADTKPDYCCSAEQVPLDDDTVDTVLMVEVLEHLENPAPVLAEAARVLRPGGEFIMSTPFLYPVHGAPHDYQRWTADKLRSAVEAAGFTAVQVAHMGGTGAVVHDLLMVSLRKVENGLLRKTGRFALKAGRFFFGWMDRVFYASAPKITTGHFVTARKPD